MSRDSFNCHAESMISGTVDFHCVRRAKPSTDPELMVHDSGFMIKGYFTHEFLTISRT